MCGFPVHSYGQRTISLWFDNSVQEGDVLKEALFVSFLVDDKGVIHIPAPELGGWWWAVLRAFCSKYSM